MMSVHIATLLAALTAHGTDIEPPPACGPGCPIVAASLTIHYDPGHDGSLRRYDVRTHAAPIARLEVWPPASGHPAPERQPASAKREPTVDEPERTAEEAARFLTGLAEAGACTVEAPEPRIGLHPVFLTLTVRDACRISHEVEWVTRPECERPDGRSCPEEPLASLPDLFQAFFDEDPPAR